MVKSKKFSDIKKLSAVGYQLSAICCQLSTLNLLATSYQLPEYSDCHERPRLESRGNSIFLAWEPVFLLMDLQKL